ncbi:OLC1v1033067C1 [Oldenlandia corymbosa var. corymbosa]|nr:OLC1v1033067C1 [Oldenlandia corymbosa var. corymbosa]
MATNRFVCEVCGKGFQREQNLQLHRRGHNLPWKLRQKTNKDQVKRKVYLCPEPSCVHHEPSRALGDLTGIKKHYSRKHGEKKYKCGKCSKKYAVQSDWKAHSKTCGTREYRCDCGTLFSRRDSFITHRAFCDALAQESARNPVPLGSISSHLFGGSSNINLGLSSQLSTATQQDHQTDILRLGSTTARSRSSTTTTTGQPFLDHHHSLIGNSIGSAFRPSHHPHPHHQTMGSSSYFMPSEPDPQQDYRHHENNTSSSPHGLLSNKPLRGLMQLADLENNSSSSSAGPGLFNLAFFPNNNNNTNDNHEAAGGSNASNLLFSSPFNNNANNGNEGGGSSLFSDSFGGHLATAGGLYSASLQNPSSSAHLSATALLQKAAQLGSTTSNSSASLMLKTTAFGNNNNPKSDQQFGGGGGGIFGNNNNNQHRSHIEEMVMTSMTGSLETSYARPPQENLSDYGYSNNNNVKVLGSFGDQLHRSTSFGGGQEGLTRDFLGMRPAGGEFGEIRALDSDRSNSPAGAAAAARSPSFGGGGGVNYQ